MHSLPQTFSVRFLAARGHKGYVPCASSSGMAETKLVYANSNSSSGSTFRVASLEQAALPTKVGNLPQQPGGVSASRLEAIELAHQGSVFSENIA